MTSYIVGSRPNPTRTDDDRGEELYVSLGSLPIDLANVSLGSLPIDLANVDGVADLTWNSSTLALRMSLDDAAALVVLLSEDDGFTYWIEEAELASPDELVGLQAEAPLGVGGDEVEAAADVRVELPTG